MCREFFSPISIEEAVSEFELVFPSFSACMNSGYLVAIAHSVHSNSFTFYGGLLTISYFQRNTNLASLTFLNFGDPSVIAVSTTDFSQFIEYF